MAESYRGLTVRIGGDTTALQGALKAATSAAAATQNQLRRIGTAMRLDPSSLDSARAKMRLVSERAVDLNSKLSTMRQAMAQLDARGIGRAAAETQNAAMRAAQAKDAYNAVTAELASLYNGVRRLTGLDPRGGMDIDRLRSDTSLAAQEAARLYDELKRVAGIDLADEVSPQEAIEAMARLGAVTEQVAERAALLGRNWAEASAELDTASQVAQYRDLEVEMRRVESEARSLAAELTRASRANVNAEQFQSLNQRIGQADESARQLEGQLRRIDSALKVDPSNVEAAALKVRNVSEQAMLAQERMGLLREKMATLRRAGVDEVAASTANVTAEAERAASAYQDVAERLLLARGRAADLERQAETARAAGKGSGEGYARLESELSAARAEMARLEAQAERANDAMNTAEACAQYERLQAEVAETSAKMRGLSGELAGMASRKPMSPDSIREIGYALSGSLTPAIVGIGYSAVNSADTLDSAFRDMKKTVDGTDAQFEELRRKAIEFSTTHVTSADQILEIQALGGQMGIAVDDLEGFAEVISNLDIATDINAEDAATQLGQLANITHMTSDEYSRFGDALVRLGNNMPSQESAIMDVSSRIGSMASILGMGVPDILAWSNAIASTGQNSEAAGTAISNTMSDIESAVAGGGEALGAFAEVAGMSAQQFADTWNGDPTSAMKAFVEGLARIDESGGSVDSTLEGLEIKGVRQKQALMGLTQTIGTLDDSLAMSRDAWNGVSDQWGAAGDAAREAQQKSEGFSGALGKLRNIASAFSSELGEAAAPAIEGLASLLSGLSKAFQGLPGPVKTATVGAMGLLAAIGPLTVAVGTVKGAFGQLKGGVSPATRSLAEMAVEAINSGTGLKDVAAQAAAAAGANGRLDVRQRAANAAMKAGAGIAGVARVAMKGLALAGIALVVSAYVDAVRKQEEFRQATEGLTGAVRDSQRASSDAGNSFLESTSKVAKAIGDMASSAASVDDLAAKQASLAGSIRDASGEAAGTASQLDHYRQVIEEFGNRSGLTADQQSRLKLAVQGVNDVTGSQWKVVDAANGKIADERDVLQETTQAISDYIEQKKIQLMLDAKQSKLGDLYGQRDRNQDKVDELATKLYKAQQEGDQIKSQSYYDQLTKAKGLLDATNQAIRDTNDQMAQMQGTIDGTADVWTRLSTVAQASGRDVGGLSEALKSQLFDQEAIGRLTNSQLDSIASSWDGTIGSIVGKLQEFGAITPQQGAAAVLGFAQGMDDAQYAVIAAAMGVQGASLQEFRKQTQQFGLEGQAQVLAYAQGIASGDTQEVAALKALQATNGLASYLSQFGVTGTAEINAFIAAVNAGDTFTVAIQKASQAVQGLGSQQGGASAAGSGTVGAFNAGALGVDTYGTGSGKGQSLAQGLASASGTAYGSGRGVAESGRAGASSVDFYGTGAAAGQSFLDGASALIGRAVDFARSAASSIGASLRGMGTTGNARGGIRLNAEGGIRAHARGAIATRAVPLDIVGEDGAEAIVPLTNKKYARPFAGLIADEVAARLGVAVADEIDRAGLSAMAMDYERHAVRTASEAAHVTVAVDQAAIAQAVARAVAKSLPSSLGDTYNMSMNGITINDTESIKADTRSFLLSLKSKAEMGRG